VRALAGGSPQSEPRNVEVGNENFVATSLDLSGQQTAAVRLTVLGSYDQAAKFLDKLNRLLLLLGLTAVLIGSGLCFCFLTRSRVLLPVWWRACVPWSTEISIILWIPAEATKSLS